MKNEAFLLREARIAILGLGLMGGSLALALKERCRHLSAYDPHPETIRLAQHQEIVHQATHDPAQALEQADLVILAAPVPAIADWLARLPRYVQHPCVVLDIGSSKRLIVEAMQALPPHFDPIGGHPICGRERLSLQNAERFLYHEAPFVLTPLPRTSPRAQSAAAQVIAALNAKPVWLDAATHDQILAVTSHLPYLLASALAAATPDEAAALIGPGFRSSTRLAGTPSSMMLGVLLSNADNVLAVLGDFRHALDSLETALRRGDASTLQSVLDASRQSYQKILNPPQKIL